INNGFRQELQTQLLGSTAHVSLERVQADGIRDWRPLLEKLRHQPNVIAAAPALYEEVLISRGALAKGALLKGIVPQYESQVSELLKSVKVGSAESLKPCPSGSAGCGEQTETQKVPTEPPGYVPAYPP